MNQPGLDGFWLVLRLMCRFLSVLAIVWWVYSLTFAWVQFGIFGLGVVVLGTICFLFDFGKTAFTQNARDSTAYEAEINRLNRQIEVLQIQAKPMGPVATVAKTQRLER